MSWHTGSESSSTFFVFLLEELGGSVVKLEKIIAPDAFTETALPLFATLRLSPFFFFFFFLEDFGDLDFDTLGLTDFVLAEDEASP